MSLTSAVAPLRARWTGLPGREKNLIRLAVLLVLAFLLWQFSVAPARPATTAGQPSAGAGHPKAASTGL